MEESCTSASLVQQTKKGGPLSLLMCNLTERVSCEWTLMEPEGKGLKGLLFESNMKPGLQVREVEKQASRMKNDII